jgi:hypothetical protein
MGKSSSGAYSSRRDRENFIFFAPRNPVLPHYAAGSRWTIAWRIAMIMLRNTVQSNILAHLLFGV